MFWDELADAIRSRTPRAWRQPAGLPPLPPDAVFAAIRASAGSPDTRVRLHLNGTPTDAPTLLPSSDDTDVASWLARVEREPGEMALVVNDLQAATPWAARLGRALVAPLHDRLGMPVRGGSLDLFSGRYARGAFGVHKDDQDVVTLVVEGKKRFHLWPFEALGENPADRLRTVLLGDRDAPDPLVLEAAPGDVLFWPAEWWHVSVAVDDSPVTSLGLGLFRSADPARLLGEAAEDDLPLFVPAGGDLGDAADALFDTMVAWISRPAARARFKEQLLARASTAGYRSLTPMVPAPPSARVRPTAPFAWMRTPEGLTLAVGGQILALPWHPGLPPLLEKLRSEAVDVAEAASAFEDESERDGITTLLHGLLALGALEPVVLSGEGRTPPPTPLRGPPLPRDTRALAPPPGEASRLPAAELPTRVTRRK